MGRKRRTKAVALPSPSVWEKLPSLTIGIAISVALHTLLLCLHFQYPEASQALQQKALDIILVNARSAQKPIDPQVLAQVNLDGGGDTDEDRRVKTPLPPSDAQNSGEDVENLKQRPQELQTSNQQQLTAEVSSKRSAAAGSDTGQGETNYQTTSNGQDLADSARAMARLQGEINKSIDEYSKRPRMKSTSGRAEEYRFARYIEDWRAKVERLGTLNYPAAARGRLYGTLVLTVRIDAEGDVRGIDISRSSGHKILDDAARRIVMMGSPYARFPSEIRQDTDILEITRTWTFTQGDTLEYK